MTDKIVIAFKEGYTDFEVSPSEILKLKNPKELHIFEMEEAYSIQEYINMVDDPVFTQAVKDNKIKIHCVHLAPSVKQQSYHYQFPDWDKLASIQPTRLRQYLPEKTFLTQNHMVGYHRDYLVEQLYKQGLFEYGYVSYKETPFEHVDDEISAQYAKDRTRTNIKRKWQQSDKLYKFFPYDAEGHIPDFVYDYFDNPPPPLDYWEKSLFNIVTESWYKPKIKDTSYISEKTYSCLYHAQPFVIVGCRYMNKLLEEQGYKQYPCFDYSFDALPSIEQRIDSVVQQTKQLSKYNMEEVYNELKPIAEYNQQKFLQDVRMIDIPNILNDDNAVIYPRAQLLKTFMQGTKNYAISKNM